MRTLLCLFSFLICGGIGTAYEVEAGTLPAAIDEESNPDNLDRDSEVTLTPSPPEKQRLHIDYNELHILRRFNKATDTWESGARHLFDARLHVGDGGLYFGYHSWNDFHGDLNDSGKGAWFGRNRITIGHDDFGLSVPSAWPKVDDWIWPIEFGIENSGDNHRPFDSQAAHVRLGYWRIHPTYSINFIEGAYGDVLGVRFSHSFYLDGLFSIWSEASYVPGPRSVSIEHFARYDEGKLISGGIKVDDLYLRVSLYTADKSAGKLVLGLTFGWYEIDDEAFFQFGDSGEIVLGGNIAFTF